MNDRYELLTPAQAVERLAAELPGGRADAEQVIASYLRDATGIHGRPSSGWRLDEFDLDDARARFGWVDFASGETVAAARTRADAAAIAALREARGTSAVTERARLEGLHSDAEMWGYRAHPVALDELTSRTACDPQPRLVTVAREGRERSHREATAAHDARVLATEAQEAAARCGHATRDLSDQHDHENEEGDPVPAPNDEHDRPVSYCYSGRPLRVYDLDDPAMLALREEMEGATAQDAAVDDGAPVDDERGDRERVLDEGPGSFVGGMWFTPDDTAEGGVRPLTAPEMRRVSDLIRATRTEVLAEELDHQHPPTYSPGTHHDSNDDGWTR